MAIEIRELLPIGLSLIVLGIALAYGMQVTADVGADMACPTTHPILDEARGYCCAAAGCTLNATHGQRLTLEGNATIGPDGTVPALAKIPAKMGLIVTVVIAVVIIGLIVRYLANVA